MVNVSHEWLRENYPDYEKVVAESGRAARATIIPGVPTSRLAACGVGLWVVEIINYRPASDNESKKGVKAWHRAKKRDRQVVFDLVCPFVPRATGRRRVALLVEKASRRGMVDGPNLNKSLNDALVQAGLLIDDSPDWAEIANPAVAIVKGLEVPVRSTITIEDLR
jgi:Holliday junction resolvase RusA-like endonuclease